MITPEEMQIIRDELERAYMRMHLCGRVTGITEDELAVIVPCDVCMDRVDRHLQVIKRKTLWVQPYLTESGMKPPERV